MNTKHYAEIVGVLTVSDSLILYDGGHYSLNGGNTVSIDTIGPLTELSAPSGALTVELRNNAPVAAKRLSVPAGMLTITGPGELTLDNADAQEAGRICGIWVHGGMTVNGGAVVRATGYNSGVYVAGLTDILTVTAESRLYGMQTGVNANLLGAGKYGVYCGGSISVSGGAVVEGRGPLDSYHSYGVFCGASHQVAATLLVAEASLVSGSASVGIYTGVITVVNGKLDGMGGAQNISHGIQGDMASLMVGPGGAVSGDVGDGGYAGVLMTNGYTINGGAVTGMGGGFGVRGANSGQAVVTGGGALVGIGGDTADSSGVFIVGGALTMDDAIVRGKGGRLGVYAAGDIAAAGGMMEGTAYAYGADSGGPYGAVISGGVITAAEAGIVENYTRREYFDAAYRIPYQRGRNMTDYRNYAWAVSDGAGQVRSDSAGAGIHADQAGDGILTARRDGNVAGEVVELDDASAHLINIPVVLTDGSWPEFMVTYVGNGSVSGNVPVDGGTPYRKGDTVTVSGNTGGLVRGGYRFAGWSASIVGGTVYRPGEAFVMSGNDVTLYAVWELLPPELFRVDYDANGAGSGSAPVVGNGYPAGAVVTVSGNSGDLVREGFQFLGWALDPRGTGVIYQEGNVFLMPGGGVTLFAVWQEAASSWYRIFYDGCRAVCGKVPIDLEVYASGKSVVVRRNYGGLFRPGFCFIGWALTPGGVVAYKPGEVFLMPGHDVILFAAWRRIEGPCCC